MRPPGHCFTLSASRASGWRGCGCRGCATQPQIRPVLLDDPWPDPLDQGEFVDAAERAVLATVFDDRARPDLPDPFQLTCERRGIGRVEIDRAGQGQRREQEQKQDEQDRLDVIHETPRYEKPRPIAAPAHGSGGAHAERVGYLAC